jgi:hypothetical protein
VKPLIIWDFSYAGPQSEAEGRLAPFESLGPINVTEGNVPYPELLHATGTGLDDIQCTSRTNHIVGNAGLQSYNITIQRQVFELFKNKVAEFPAFAGSAVILESYSSEMVRVKDAESSAFPLRDDYLLL